jgi:hypothetical protein
MSDQTDSPNSDATKEYPMSDPTTPLPGVRLPKDYWVDRPEM